jgi:hypothetical protein
MKINKPTVFRNGNFFRDGFIDKIHDTHEFRLPRERKEINKSTIIC